jgi:peptidylprolyl isomerase
LRSAHERSARIVPSTSTSQGPGHDVSARTTTVTLLVSAALGIAACGGADKTASTITDPDPPATAAAPATTTTSGGGATPRAVSRDLDTKPEIPKPGGSPPTKLVVKDIVKGKGKTAKSGRNVTVQYVGVSYSTGEQFDASWDRGQPFQFQLGAQMVIPGWDRGVSGMKEGGRRELIIPPDQAYGAEGRPGIAPNETLVFVIDLLSVD